MAGKEASDLHLKPMRPPLLRVKGKLVPLKADALQPAELAPARSREIVKALVDNLAAKDMPVVVVATLLCLGVANIIARASFNDVEDGVLWTSQPEGVVEFSHEVYLRAAIPAPGFAAATATPSSFSSPTRRGSSTGSSSRRMLAVRRADSSASCAAAGA